MEDQNKRKIDKFLISYCHLLNRQLDKVEEIRGSTTDRILQSIQDLDKGQGDLLKRITTLNGQLPTDKGGGSETSEENVLNKKVAIKDEIESKLSEAIFEMMGALSNDDVVSQRIEHVRNSTIRLMKELTNCVFHDHGAAVNFHQLLEDMSKEFTMESEKTAYKTVYGN